MTQRFEYLYPNNLSEIPQSFLDMYKDSTPYLKVIENLTYTKPREDKTPDIILSEVIAAGGYDLKNLTEAEQQQLEADAKEAMVTTTTDQIILGNSPMYFLPYFSDLRYTGLPSGSYALSNSSFYSKCKNNEVGIELVKKEDDEGNITYHIIRNDAYKYFYVNKVYLTIGNMGVDVSGISDSTQISEFQHYVMKVHILAQADGRKITPDGSTPTIPNMKVYFRNNLPDPFSDTVWEDDNGIEISKNDLTDFYSVYSTMVNAVSTYFATDTPILKMYIEAGDGRFSEQITSPYWFKFTDLYNGLNYLLARYYISHRLYISSTGGYKENHNYTEVQFPDSSYKNIAFYFNAASEMGTFHHLEVYF